MARAKLEVFESRLVEMAEFARALSHPARIRILQMLSDRGEVACMEIVGELPLSQPTCSRHVNELLKAGLLKARHSGNQVLFRLEKAALRRFCESMNRTLHSGKS